MISAQTLPELLHKTFFAKKIMYLSRLLQQYHRTNFSVLIFCYISNLISVSELFSGQTTTITPHITGTSNGQPQSNLNQRTPRPPTLSQIGRQPRIHPSKGPKNFANIKFHAYYLGAKNLAMV